MAGAPMLDNTEFDAEESETQVGLAPCLRLQCLVSSHTGVYIQEEKFNVQL